MPIWNERIRSKRQEKGITLAQIADKLGVTEATAQRYESGNIKSVPYDHMCAYGEILGCSPAYLMGWEKVGTHAELDIFEELLALIGWTYEVFSECDGLSANEYLDDEDKVHCGRGSSIEDCNKCELYQPYYYLTNNKLYYKITKPEFEELSYCIKPYLEFRINQMLSKKEGISEYEYELQESLIEPDETELNAAHENPEGATQKQRDNADRIMMDDKEWE